MEIVYLIIGIIVGTAATWLAARSREKASETLLRNVKEEHEKRIADVKAEHQTQMDALQKNHEKQLEAQHTRNDKQLERLKESYKTQVALMKEQVTTATERLLKQRGKELQEANTSRMLEIFAPLKEDIKNMEEAIRANREAAVQRQASLTEVMKQMMDNTVQLGTQADRLACALQRKNKTAGNWGELVLTEMLEGMGLQEGVHFDVQQSMKDSAGHSLVNEETGSRMIPDVILHLADQRDVVVDSKVSLTALADYRCADTDKARQDALQRNHESVAKHVKELVGKDYSAYIQKPRVGAGFVIMFVPIDAALNLALQVQPDLWRKAFANKVFIATSQTLMAALRIIDLTWVNVLQERNTQKIMDVARKLIDRVSKFYEEFQVIDRKLTDVQRAFSAVTKRVDDGPHSILATGHRLEALGARGKKALPTPDEA